MNALIILLSLIFLRTSGDVDLCEKEMKNGLECSEKFPVENVKILNETEYQKFLPIFEKWETCMGVPNCERLQKYVKVKKLNNQLLKKMSGMYECFGKNNYSNKKTYCSIESKNSKNCSDQVFTNCMTRLLDADLHCNKEHLEEFKNMSKIINEICELKKKH